MLYEFPWPKGPSSLGLCNLISWHSHHTSTSLALLFLKYTKLTFSSEFAIPSNWSAFPTHLVPNLCYLIIQISCQMSPLLRKLPWPSSHFQWCHFCTLHGTYNYLKYYLPWLCLCLGAVYLDLNGSFVCFLHFSTPVSGIVTHSSFSM